MSKNKSWDCQIKILANAFCLHEAKVAEIVNYVRSEYPGKSDSYLYDRAYSRIKPLIMNI